MPPLIAWARRADHRFRMAQRKIEAQLEPSDIQTQRNLLDDKLKKAFGDALSVMILNYYVGFKVRRDEHILQVDVRLEGQSNSYVVKIAEHRRLESEKDAWEQCGLSDTNPVFLPLIAKSDPQTGQLIAICYQDAETHIGIESTMWLERAVQYSIRFNAPKVTSVCHTIQSIYLQAGRLYETGRLIKAEVGPIETLPKTKGGFYPLSASWDKWQEPKGLKIRRSLNGLFPVTSESFLDPVDYLHALDQLNRSIAIAPPLYRGLAHGDLHGRNSIVGIDSHEEANFPTLFDYESIHRDNLIGWDFVELEIELKIRCYDFVFGTNLLAVHNFEKRLAEAAQELQVNQSGDYAKSTPEERLFAVIMTIRRQALIVLSRPLAGKADWLKEYFFLLSVYSVGSIRFGNQKEIEDHYGYISAGVAAAALSHLIAWPEGQSAPRVAEPLKAIRKAIRNKQPSADLPQQLNELVNHYPAQLPVWFERAFYLAKQKQTLQAIDCLEEIEKTFPLTIDEECYSLWGRCYKDRGDQCLLNADAVGVSAEIRKCHLEDADAEYEKAILQYERAYRQHRGAFPGINLATLHLIRQGIQTQLGKTAEIAPLAENIRRYAGEIEAAKLPLKYPDDNIWTKAMKAEAALPLGNMAVALHRYEQATREPNIQSHHLDSMASQVKRILKIYGLLNQTIDVDAFQKLFNIEMK
jgi:tetratricopeptide (TPR) repeat protein